MIDRIPFAELQPRISLAALAATFPPGDSVVFLGDERSWLESNRESETSFIIRTCKKRKFSNIYFWDKFGSKT